MMNDDGTPVSVLGLGAMGTALAAAVLNSGRPLTVWNRSNDKADDLVSGGAKEATTVEAAVGESSIIVACLLDHASVHEVLDPVVDQLSDRTVINVTTTTPNQARELASWAADHGIDYLDGGIMAIPSMIGHPGSAILYSGSQDVYERNSALFALWGESSYFGADAGMASLYDLAMLAGMYTMFAGFLQGAAMVHSEGISVADFASRTGPFLAAMTGSFAELARVVDAGDYAGPGQQSLEFSDLSDMVQAAHDQGVNAAVIDNVQSLIRRQIDAGYGTQGFARIFEELKR